MEGSGIVAEIIRSYHYDENGEPYMRLSSKRPRATGSFPLAIRLQDLWQFAEDKNPDWRAFMATYAQRACRLLDLGEPTTWRMGQVADVIANGIDELIKMPPAPTLEIPMENVEVDASLTVNGKDTVKLRSDYAVEEVIDIY
jgi:hypothetical protein